MGRLGGVDEEVLGLGAPRGAGAGGWERLGCWELQKRGSGELTNREWIGDGL